MPTFISLHAPRPTRRWLLAGGVAAVAAVAGGVGGRAWLLRRPFDTAILTPPEASALADAGKILLIDIRRPDEWAETGVPAGAHPLDMRRPDFTQALLALAGGNPGRPIALICARGVRSNRMSGHLAEAGFTRIGDVGEGMLGSPDGPGWLARGLPVTPFAPASETTR